MEAARRPTVTEWLRANRGEMTQADLADDIKAVTGWNITRDRYSKYESGKLPVGAVVKAHFARYWAVRGKPGPDEPVPMAGEGLVDAIPSPAAFNALLQEMREQTAATRELTLAIGQAMARIAEAEEDLRRERARNRRLRRKRRPADHDGGPAPAIPGDAR